MAATATKLILNPNQPHRDSLNTHLNLIKQGFYLQFEQFTRRHFDAFNDHDGGLAMTH
jgi:hypothetical protein